MRFFVGTLILLVTQTTMASTITVGDCVEESRDIRAVRTVVEDFGWGGKRLDDGGIYRPSELRLRGQSEESCADALHTSDNNQRREDETTRAALQLELQEARRHYILLSQTAQRCNSESCRHYSQVSALNSARQYNVIRRELIQLEGRYLELRQGAYPSLP